MSPHQCSQSPPGWNSLGLRLHQKEPATTGLSPKHSEMSAFFPSLLWLPEQKRLSNFQVLKNLCWHYGLGRVLGPVYGVCHLHSNSLTFSEVFSWTCISWNVKKAEMVRLQHQQGLGVSTKRICNLSCQWHTLHTPPCSSFQPWK